MVETHRPALVVLIETDDWRGAEKDRPRQAVAGADVPLQQGIRVREGFYSPETASSAQAADRIAGRGDGVHASANREAAIPCGAGRATHRPDPRGLRRNSPPRRTRR